MDNNNFHNHNSFPPVSDEYSSSRIYSTSVVDNNNNNNNEQTAQHPQSLEDISSSFNQDHSLNPGASFPAADAYTSRGGPVDPSEAERVAMELIGITPTTFSSNVQFRVPRLMQDSFDPALLHSTRTMTTSGETASINATYGSSNENYATSGYYVSSPTVVSYYPQHAATGPGSSNNPNMAVMSGPRAGQKPSRSSAALALNGLPIYSASGFDMLDILARIATRPNPKVALGPVDMTCAFLVVDITRPDCPIIYSSQTFSELTGYAEEEVLGKNCRFLQAPPGVTIEKGSPRAHTDIESVTTMAQNLALNREVQVTLVNYKKNGEAFINCVTVIPVIPYDHRPGVGGANSGSCEPVRYHVGFQVDLAVQPHAIMKSVQNGSYITNYSSTPLPPVVLPPSKLNMRVLTKNMSEVMTRMDHLAPAGITTGADNPKEISDGQAPAADRTKLSLALLEHTPDPIFVVSLKGTFLYVSPSISRLLQYTEEWFLGKNLQDICHPDDLAPTMRNVKEFTSSNVGSGTGIGTLATAAANGVDVQLLYRGRRSDGSYVWLDCSGKLHADTSRGRKALLLRLRNVDLPKVSWESISTPVPSSNSMPKPYFSSTSDSTALGGVTKDECFLRLARDERGLIVSCPPYIPPSARGIEAILGRKIVDVIGKELSNFVVDDARGTKHAAIRNALIEICGNQDENDSTPRYVFCNMPATVAPRKSKGKRGKGKDKIVLATVEMTFFPPRSMNSSSSNSTPSSGTTSISNVTSSSSSTAKEKHVEREINPGSEVTLKSKPMTIIVRLRVLQKRAMRTEMSDIPSISAHDAVSADPYSSKVTGSSSFLPFSSGEIAPFSGFGSNPMEQLHSPVQMFHQASSSSANLGLGGGISSKTFETTPKNGGRRSRIYPVRATGDVNAISDGVTSANADSNASDAGASATVASQVAFANSGNGNNSTGSPSTNLSWQYELQQLRMQNEKMRSELEGIETDYRAKRKEKNMATSQNQRPGQELQQTTQPQSHQTQSQYIFDSSHPRHSGQTPSQYVRQQQQQQSQQHQQSQQRLREHRRKKSLGQAPSQPPQPPPLTPTHAAYIASGSGAGHVHSSGYFSTSHSVSASSAPAPPSAAIDVEQDRHVNTGGMDWSASSGSSGVAGYSSGGMGPPHLNLSMPQQHQHQHQHQQQHVQTPTHGMPPYPGSGDGGDANGNPQNNMHEWSRWGH